MALTATMADDDLSFSMMVPFQRESRPDETPVFQPMMSNGSMTASLQGRANGRPSDTFSPARAEKLL
jgi:hypothetical protein